MRIALYHNLPSGGAKRAVFEWVRRLAGDHSIDVFSLTTADHTFCDIRPFTRQYKIYEFTPRNLFKSPFGRLNQFQRWRDLGDLDNLSRQIAMQINSGEYDILFAHTCKFTFIPALMQYIEIPSVYYLHEPFGPNFLRQFERPYLAKNGWRETLNHIDPLIWVYKHRLSAIQKRSVQNTTRLLANSQYTHECIRTEFSVDADHAPLGVDLEGFYREANVQREDFVVSVGELSPRKGFDFVVESLGKLPAHIRPKLKLACNSINNDELEFINNLAQRSDVDLEVLSNLGIDELRSLYNRARLCVYAPVMEPFGLVLLEAMACGTAVIGVDDGGVKESIVHKQTGLLVDREQQQFAAAIQHLLSNPTLASEYGRNGRNHVMNNWTWDQATAKLKGYLNIATRSKLMERKEV